MKIRLTLETDMKKLFESDKNHMGNPKTGKLATSTDRNDFEPDAIPPTPDVQIALLKAPMILYKELTLDTSFRQYLETILFSAKALRMGVQKTPYQKTYELQAGSQDFTVDFQEANRQFDWIEIFLTYDKSDKQLTAHDSYSAECASKFIKSLEFPNIRYQHSSTNTLNFDIGNDLQKYLLWKQYLTWCTNECSTAPMTDFINKPIARELKKENEYFSDKFDERLYVDLIPSHGYTDELEKPTRNDSKMTITIETKAPSGLVIDNIAAPLIKGVVKKIIGRGVPPRRRRQRRNYRIVIIKICLKR